MRVPRRPARRRRAAAAVAAALLSTLLFGLSLPALVGAQESAHVANVAEEEPNTIMSLGWCLARWDVVGSVSDDEWARTVCHEDFPEGVRAEGHILVITLTWVFVGVVIIGTIVSGVIVKGVSLPLLLTCLQLATVSLAGTVTWVVTYQKAQEQIEIKTQDLLLQAGARSATGLAQDLGMGVVMNNIAAELYQDELINVAADFPEIHKYLNRIVRSFWSASRTLFALYLGTADINGGKLQGVQRLNSGGAATCEQDKAYNPDLDLERCKKSEFNESFVYLWVGQGTDEPPGTGTSCPLFDNKPCGQCWRDNDGHWWHYYDSTREGRPASSCGGYQLGCTYGQCNPDDNPAVKALFDAEGGAAPCGPPCDPSVAPSTCQKRPCGMKNMGYIATIDAGVHPSHEYYTVDEYGFPLVGWDDISFPGLVKMGKHEPRNVSTDPRLATDRNGRWADGFLDAEKQPVYTLPLTCQPVCNGNDTYDPRGRPWFTTHHVDIEITRWSGVYEFVQNMDEIVMGITATRGVKSKDGVWAAVLAADYTMGSFYPILKDLRPSENSLVLVTDLKGLLIAGSVPMQKLAERVSTRNPNDGKENIQYDKVDVLATKIPPERDCNHPDGKDNEFCRTSLFHQEECGRTRATWKGQPTSWAAEHSCFDIFQRVSNTLPPVENFKPCPLCPLSGAGRQRAILQHGTSVLLVQPINVEGGLTWVMVIEMPFVDILESVEDAGTEALWLSTLIAVACGLIVAVFVNLVLWPLKLLESAMMEVAVMKLDGAAMQTRAGGILEVRRMRTSFMTMVANLVEFRRFLPAACLEVAGDDDSPSGADEGAPDHRNSVTPASATKSGKVSRRNSAAAESSKAEERERHKKMLRVGDFKTKRASVFLARLDRNQQGKYSDTLASMSFFTSLVLDVVQRNDGLIVAIAEWDGSMHVLASWNAHKPHPSHARQACTTAVSVAQALKQQEAEYLKTDAWCSAVATGILHVGNLGNDVQRVPVVSGMPVLRASGLAKLGNSIHLHSVCGDSTFEQVRSQVSARIVDAVITSRGEEVMVYELLEETFDGDLYIQAFSDLRTHAYTSALEKLRAYLSQPAGGGDQQALRLFSVALLMSKDNSCLSTVHDDKVFARQEQPAWQDLEKLASVFELPEDVQEMSKRGQLESLVAADQGSASGSLNKRPSLGRKPSRGNETAFLQEQIKDAYRQVDENSMISDSLPIEFKDARGRTYHRSDKQLGRGAFGEVWLGMGADGAMVAVKCLRLKEVAGGAPPDAGQGSGDGGAWTVGGGDAWTVGGDAWTVGPGAAAGGADAGAAPLLGGGGWTVTGAEEEPDSAAAAARSHASGVTTLTAAGMTMARRQVQEMVTEVALMTQLRHDNIVQYLGCAVIGSHVLIVMEYLPGGSLQGVMKQFSGKLPPSSVKRFTRDVVQGLAFIHSNRIVHRDLKPANVLVTHEGQCKLADFGASAELGAAAAKQQMQHERQKNEAQPAEADGDPIGTPMYMPPEQAKGVSTTASDIWSLGIVVCEFCTGRVPWGDVGNILRFMIQLGDDASMVPTIPEQMPPQARDLAAKCVVRPPRERPAAKALLSHPFLLT